MTEEVDYPWSCADTSHRYRRPVSSDAARLLPSKESSVHVQQLDDGTWLVTETAITRRVQAERPRFEVVNPEKAA